MECSYQTNIQADPKQCVLGILDDLRITESFKLAIFSALFQVLNSFYNIGIQLTLQPTLNG